MSVLKVVFDFVARVRSWITFAPRAAGVAGVTVSYPAEHPVPTPNLTVAPKRMPQEKDDRAKQVEEAGRWYFKRDILDQLEEYFKTLDVLRKGDADTYSLCAGLGAVLTSPETMMLFAEKNHSRYIPEDQIGALSFGALAPFINTKQDSADTDRVDIKFLAFRKLSRTAPNVQPSNHTRYCVSGVYILDKKKPIQMDFYVDIPPNGTPRLLKSLTPKTQSIPFNKRYEGTRHTWVVRMAWEYPTMIREIAEKNKESPQDSAAKIFSMAYHTYLNANADVIVRASRGTRSATFGVDLLRVPYFFKDRTPVIDASGKKKKIFHIVRTHERETKSGSSFVRSHFRGLRKFSWNGYDVNISMPGKHHADVLSARFAAEEYGEAELAPRGLISMSDAVKKIVSEQTMGAAK